MRAEQFELAAKDGPDLANRVGEFLVFHLAVRDGAPRVIQLTHNYLSELRPVRQKLGRLRDAIQICSCCIEPKGFHSPHVRFGCAYLGEWLQSRRSVRSVKIIRWALSAALLLPLTITGWSAAVARPQALDERQYPRPVLPFDTDTAPDPVPTVTLAEAISQAYRSNPTIGAQRYELRATDETLAQALARTRATAEVQVAGGYDKTVPGRTTQAGRPLLDRLGSPIVTNNDLGAQLIVTQPLLTGGRAHAAIASANEDIRAGREVLRQTEGDLLAQVIAAYVNVRRDTQAVRIRRTNLRVLEATLDEVIARREAGELTRTDIAQAQTQRASARVQLNAAEGQLEVSRADYAALVGDDPGVLAAEPALPLIPGSIDAAFDIAERNNPELAQAIYAERGSRARIAAARAEGNPSLALRGTASLNGQAAPFYLYNMDQGFAGRLTLTVPLAQGGRVGSLVAQAADRNSADRLRIEAARRRMVSNISTAWNQMVVSARNLDAQAVQLEAARVFYEGTFEEYRAGLRSTFDVLFAQNSLRDTEISLIASRRDLYVAQASLLRQLGQLEVGKLLTGTALYEPAANLRRVQTRSALPWDGAIRAFDRLDRLDQRQQMLETPAKLPDTPAIAPAGDIAALPVERLPLAIQRPNAPLPGTTGAPVRRKKP